jgi:hypothetical protein
MKDCIIKDDDHWFILEIKDGRALFDVTCGTIGLYGVRFYLNDEELQRFEEEGREYLRDLAYRVCKYEPEYAHRKVCR